MSLEDVDQVDYEGLVAEPWDLSFEDLETDFQGMSYSVYSEEHARFYDQIPLEKGIIYDELAELGREKNHQLSHVLSKFRDSEMALVVEDDPETYARTLEGNIFYRWGRQIEQLLLDCPEDENIFTYLREAAKYDAPRLYGFLPAESYKSVAEEIPHRSNKEVTSGLKSLENLTLVEREVFHTGATVSIDRNPENEWLFSQIRTLDERIREPY